VILNYEVQIITDAAVSRPCPDIFVTIEKNMLSNSFRYHSKTLNCRAHIYGDNEISLINSKGPDA
jgi:hypothetical protein